MTTIFISKMESLPPTSATKMIDYWLILCQLVPFTQVVLLTAIEFRREEEQDENTTVKKNDKLEVVEPAPTNVKEKSILTNIQSKEEPDTKPNEVFKRTPSSTSSVVMLQKIGNLSSHSHNSKDST